MKQRHPDKAETPSSEPVAAAAAAAGPLVRTWSSDGRRAGDADVPRPRTSNGGSATEAVQRRGRAVQPAAVGRRLNFELDRGNSGTATGAWTV